VGNRGDRRILGRVTERPRAFGTGLLAAVLLCALGAGAPNASAVLVKLRSGPAISYARASHASERAGRGPSFDAMLTNLDYNGGPVMPANTNYAVYWDPAGAASFPSDYEPGINRYFEDLAHDSGGHHNVDSIATQYNDAEGSFASYSSQFGGALIDENPFPASGCTHAPKCLTDEQIRTELVKFVKVHQLPADLAHEYFLFTPEGVENCLTIEEGGAPEEICSANVKDEYAEYCAYHGNIPFEGGGELIYATDPFVNGKNCDEANHPSGKSSDSVLIAGLSHEHVESITDPEPNNAWTDWGGATGEIGDKCRTGRTETEYGTALGKAENGAAYNQLINGHQYWYQQEWSNTTHQCLQRLESAGEPPTATFTSQALTGTEMSFNASGSTTGAGVKYNWQFNDAGHKASSESALETESPSVTHKFPAAERFMVALTVLRSDGTSIGTARTIAVGDEGPTAAYSLSAAAPTAGVAVELDGSGSSDADGSIAAYRWSFGDGSRGAGERPSHTYAQPGAYTVTLTITDASGQTAALSRTLQVAGTKVAQSIAFTSSAPANATVGGPGYTVSAAASSGLAVTFSPATPSICSVSASSVSFRAAGSCTIDADQPGNASYQPAPQVQQSFFVLPAEPPSGSPSPAPQPAESLLAPAELLPAPDSRFVSVSVNVNARTGAIAITESVRDPGTLSWLLTFANGRFGVFGASPARCARGSFEILGGRCRPARVVFAHGARTVALPGFVSFTAKPSAPAAKALRSALAHRRGLAVIVHVTFQSALGGVAVSRAIALRVRTRR
jgi:PKD repeat protein